MSDQSVTLTESIVKEIFKHEFGKECVYDENCTPEANLHTAIEEYANKHYQRGVDFGVYVNNLSPW